MRTGANSAPARTPGALTCYWQAVLTLRWFRDGGNKAALGRDHGVSCSTAYRYIDEVIDALACLVPGLREVLERTAANGPAYVILDGKVFATDRCGEQTTSVKGDLRVDRGHRRRCRFNTATG